MKTDIFENLFVLELANNHWGDIKRGKKIIRDHGYVAKFNNVTAAIKLQFRDVDQFIHPEYKNNKDIRYIKKTEATKLCKEGFAELVNEIKNVGAIPMSTPFDEKSVDLCQEFDMPIIKIASSDITAWPLIKKIALTRKPTIVSTGGAYQNDIDNIVRYFANRKIPLALNHCVSLYPSEDQDLELHQIDYLKNRYPDNVIGFSTHEYHDWFSSMLISYAKGVRTWERHVDIDYNGVEVSKYCSLPENCDRWFKAFHKAREMCGSSLNDRRVISSNEEKYLDALVRGIYAKKDVKKNTIINSNNFDEYFYLAIPLRKGQLSVKEVINGNKILNDIKKNDPVTINDVDGILHDNNRLKNIILDRGIDA